MLVHKQWKRVKHTGPISSFQLYVRLVSTSTTSVGSAKVCFIPTDERLFLCLLWTQEVWWPRARFQPISDSCSSAWQWAKLQQHFVTPRQTIINLSLHLNYSRADEPTATHQLFIDSLLAGLAASEAYTSNEAPDCICKKPDILWRRWLGIFQRHVGSLGPPSSFNERTRRLPSQSHH